MKSATQISLLFEDTYFTLHHATVCKLTKQLRKPLHLFIHANYSILHIQARTVNPVTCQEGYSDFTKIGN